MANKDGLSVRFMRSYDASQAPMSSCGVNRDLALMIAVLWDDREDVPFAQRLADAYEFLKSRVH